MTLTTTASRQLCLYSLLCLSHHALGATRQPVSGTLDTPTATTGWTSTTVQHVYGLPGAKAKDRGSLSISRNSLVFAGKSSAATVQAESILAVSSDNERVELWGWKGRVLRMAIPNGGGLAAAAVMHHKVHMLTVEFNDSNGAYHSAVFFLPDTDAAAAVQRIAALPPVSDERATSSCTVGPIKPGTVRVLAPTSSQLDVPAAYRGLVYERLIDRLRRTKGIQGVYRDGEQLAVNECPQYTVDLSVASFRPGSQVKRSTMGPVGMFVGTTQLTFDLRIVDSGVQPDYRAQVKATTRGESESLNVADGLAKKLVKQLTGLQKRTPDSHRASII
ncbi:hypothetical protein [uncultured Paludibaculum sp.]|uniref:hypothetical protein n=1 Tax=uncultured Paludibaculum sp. TaxID=1765020 RepID=UPI002AAAA585|nr:hypothetical protein [uncultured Paludibaculum sp.]